MFGPLRLWWSRILLIVDSGLTDRRGRWTEWSDAISPWGRHQDDHRSTQPLVPSPYIICPRRPVGGSVTQESCPCGRLLAGSVADDGHAHPGSGHHRLNGERRDPRTKEHSETQMRLCRTRGRGRFGVPTGDSIRGSPSRNLNEPTSNDDRGRARRPWRPVARRSGVWGPRTWSYPVRNVRRFTGVSSYRQSPPNPLTTARHIEKPGRARIRRKGRFPAGARRPR